MLYVSSRVRLRLPCWLPVITKKLKRSAQKTRASHPMDSTVLIENTAQEFWVLTGGAPSYPRDIKTAITWTLPLEVSAVPQLRINDVLAWTQRVNITLRIQGRNRRLHGCLIAYRGKGTIFFDANDSEDEQRFTLAHELAHFLLDYQAPRQRAVAILGTSILPVLDGDRSPTVAERMSKYMLEIGIEYREHMVGAKVARFF